MWNHEGSKTQSQAARQPVPVASPAKPAEQRTTARIGKSVFIKGDVVSAEDLTIDGRFEGTLVLGDHCLTVGAGAAIQADLKARALVISGTVTGNVMATERVEILETASVDGDIKTPRLTVREGAILRGRIDTSAETAAEKVSHFPIAV
jgi:cytoskeletal protein CcmA (bactofilin family)